ncbi:pilus assembly protein PilW, partial [Acinetobacter baumannii]
GAGDTVSTLNNQWKGLSNIQNSSNATIQSDQLTIQFIAPSNMTNCEGVNVLAGDLVVERYFLRLDNNGSSQQDYALACDAN